MLRIDYLKEKMNRKINIYGLGSVEALTASKELDKEIVKEQLKRWRDYQCKH